MIFSNKFILSIIILLFIVLVSYLILWESITNVSLSDSLLLYSMSAITLLLVLFSLKLKSTFRYFNLGLFLSYTFIFYYSLFFKNEQGLAFLYWTTCIVVTFVHFCLLMLFLAIKYWRAEH
jgi:hypothetical protein